MSDLIKVQKINESFSRISGPKDILLEIFGTLKVERPDAKFDPGVQGGWKDPFTYFCKSDGKDLFVPNGLLDFLSKYGIQGEQKTTEFTEEEIDKFLEDILTKLPFPPHDFQVKTFKESLLRGKQINRLCTSAGKSLSISLIVEFLRLKGKKGLLLVPNINLLTQFKDDIKSYNLVELYENTHVIGGGQTIRHFEKPLTISTWQSLQNHKKGLDEIDFIIVDECLHPETLIRTLDSETQIQHIKKGDIVLTLNEETKTYEYKPVIKLHKNLGVSKKEKMLKLTMEDGTILKITGNHKVLTNRGWVRADEINKNDDIVNFTTYK